jgi:hypothetical protein
MKHYLFGRVQDSFKARVKIHLIYHRILAGESPSLLEVLGSLVVAEILALYG